jgi:hypothetical protein
MLGNVMPDASTLAKYYESLSDAELLNLRGQSGFTEQAEQALAEELKRRNLKAGDVKRHAIPERVKLREEAQEKGMYGKGPALLFFGRHYLDEADKRANIQLRTKWFVLGGIPLIPLASYRFKCTRSPGKWFGWDTGQRVINRVPLNWPQIFLTWLKTAIFFFLVFLLAFGYFWYQGRGRR